MLRSVLRLAVFVFAFATLPSRVFAAAVTIDFDALGDGDVVTNQFAGLTFSNTMALTAGVSLNEFEFPPHSGTTVVSDDGGPIRIDFASPVSDVGGFFTYSAPLFLRAYDAANTSLGSVTSLFSANEALSGDPGSSPNEFLQLAFGGISYVTITGDLTGGSVVLDDLRYTTSTTATPVPEPATLSLVLLGAAGLVRSRRSLRSPVDDCR